MKTLYLEIKDSIYEKIIKTLKRFRGVKIKYSQKEKIEKLLTHSDIIPFQNIDPIKYQRSIREEWD